MTKLADPTPACCAACFNAVDERYVNFEAAYDGPVIPGTPVPVPVDDLFICESCLNAAFDLLDPQGLKQTISALEEEVRTSHQELDAKDKIIQGLRSTTNELVEHPVKTFPGKTRL